MGSETRRRVYRTKVKYDSRVIPRRFKVLSRPPPVTMPQELDFEVYVELGLEVRVFAVLEEKGVPSDQEKYYAGYAKKLWNRALRFNAATYQLEKTSLINEYVERGLDPAVLDQLEPHSLIFAEVKKQGIPWGLPAYLYVGLDTADEAFSVGGFVEGVPSPLTKVVTRPFNSGEPFVESLAIHGSYLYAGLRTAPGRIVKVYLPAHLKISTLRLAAGENYAFALAVHGNYLYVGLGTSPGKIVKVDLATFEPVATLTLPAGENNIRALAVHDGYLYAGLSTLYAQGRIVRIDLATFTRDAVVVLNPNEHMPYSLEIVDGYLYAGLRFRFGWPARVVKVSLDPFQRDSVLTVGGVGELVYDVEAANGYLYASRVAAFSKVDLSTFTWVDSLAVPSGWHDPYCLLFYQGFLYAGFIMFPARICKIDLATFTVAETLTLGPYDVDIYDLAAPGAE